MFSKYSVVFATKARGGRVYTNGKIVEPFEVKPLVESHLKNLRQQGFTVTPKMGDMFNGYRWTGQRGADRWNSDATATLKVFGLTENDL